MLEKIPLGEAGDMNLMSINPLAGFNSPLGATVSGMPMATGNQALQRSSGLTGVQAGTGMDGLLALQNQQLQLLTQLLQLLMMLMMNGGLGANLTGAAGTSAYPTGASGAATSAATGAGAVDPTTGAGAAAGGDRANVQIGPGTKVLEIGDSHTVGAYGQELEKLLEGKGAKVDRYAAVGTSAGSWLNGSGGAQSLEALIARSKPDVIIINLGANSRGGVGANEKRLAQIAQKSGAKVIWVGPPTTRQDMSNRASLQNYDQKMRNTLNGLATYISSAPYTPTYSGGDGIHYNSSTARQWAQGVFSAII